METNDELIADGGEVLEQPKRLDFSRPTIIALIAAGILIFAFGIGLAIVLYSNRNTPPPPPTIVPQESAPAPEKPKIKSKLATDSAVLKLGSDLSALKGEIDRADLVEPQLTPPILDLDISL